MEWVQLLSIGLTVSTVATLAGLGLLRGTVTNLREQLRDERDLAGSLRQRLTEADSRLEVLSNDLNALGRVVTGEAHWIAIGQQLDQHHDEARAHWQVEAQLLRDVLDALKASR